MRYKTIIFSGLTLWATQAHSIMKYDDETDTYSTTTKAAHVDQGYYNNLIHYCNYLASIADEFSPKYIKEKMTRLIIIKYLNDEHSFTAQVALQDVKQLWIADDYIRKQKEPWTKRFKKSVSRKLNYIKLCAKGLWHNAVRILPTRKVIR